MLYLNEAFKKLNLLEDDFSFSDDTAIDELTSYVKDDIDAPEEEIIIDTEADDCDDIQDAYIGKVILECNCCHSRIYKNIADVIIDHEANQANVEEECPVCGKTCGFTVVGKIEEFAEVEEKPAEEEVPAEEPVEDDISDADIEEALKEEINACNEAIKNDVKVEFECEDCGHTFKKAYKKDYFENEEDLHKLMDESNIDCPKCGGVAHAVSVDEALKEEHKEDVCQKCGKNPCVCEKKDESLTEDVQIDMDSKQVHVAGDDVKVDVNAGTVEVGNESAKADEMIAPLSDEDIAQIDGHQEEAPVEEPGLDAVDEPVDDLGAEADANVEDDIGLDAAGAEAEVPAEEEPVEGEEEAEDEEEVPNESLEQNKLASDDSKKLDEEKDPEKELKKEQEATDKEAEKEIKDAAKSVSGDGKVCEAKEEESLQKEENASEDSKKLDEAKKINVTLNDNINRIGKAVCYQYGTLENAEHRGNQYVFEYEDDDCNIDSLILTTKQVQKKLDSFNKKPHIQKAYILGESIEEDHNLDHDITVNDNVDHLSHEEEKVEEKDEDCKDCCEDLITSMQEFDEASFNSLAESYLKRVYSNVQSFVTESVKEDNNNLMVEGLITFNSGASKHTTFNFANPKVSKRGNIVLEGMNKTFSNNSKAFIVRGNTKDNKFVCESMIYNYNTKSLNESNETEAVRIYGRCVNK